MSFKKKRRYNNDELMPYLSPQEKMIADALSGDDKNNWIDLSIDCNNDKYNILQEIEENKSRSI